MSHVVHVISASALPRELSGKSDPSGSMIGSGSVPPESHTARIVQKEACLILTFYFGKGRSEITARVKGYGFGLDSGHDDV